MNEEYALGFLGLLVAPIVVVGVFMVKTLVDLKERIAVLETKADIFHPKDK